MVVVWVLLVVFFPAVVQADWGPDVKLTNFVNKAEEHPRVACYNNYVHVVWYEEAGGAGYYLRSTDNGTSWGSPFRLWDSSGYLPSIAANDSFVHVAWQIPGPGRCVYRRSSDNGSTWGRFDTVTFSGYGWPFLAVAGDTVYLLAYDGFLYREVIKKSTDRGLTWGPFQNVAPMGSRGGFALCSPYLHVSLEKQDTITISPEQYYTKSTDGGGTWSPTVMVSDSDRYGSQWAAICSDRFSNPHITWFDYKYSPYPLTGDIFHRASRDTGKTWGAIDSLTVEHRAKASSIVAQRDTLHLAWEDDRVQPNTNQEIYYRMSTDLGRTWGSVERLTYVDENAMFPSLSVGDTFLHLVWTDSRPDTIASYRQIYYKRKTLFPSGVEGSISFKLGRTEAILRVFPNPSKSSFWIYSSACGISIYDMSGRLVRHLVSTPKANSQKPIAVFLWDGRDDSGREVRSGEYFIQMKSSKGVKVTKKVTVLKGDK